MEPGGSRRPSMHRGDEGQPEPPLVSSRSVGCSAILRGQANWPRVPGLTPQVQPTVRLLREFLGSSFPISPRHNPCCGTATAAPGVTSTHEDTLLPPPISTRRCRFGVTETLRCAVGKSSTMRCRFAELLPGSIPRAACCEGGRAPPAARRPAGIDRPVGVGGGSWAAHEPFPHDRWLRLAE